MGRRGVLFGGILESPLGLRAEVGARVELVDMARHLAPLGLREGADEGLDEEVRGLLVEDEAYAKVDRRASHEVAVGDGVGVVALGGAEGLRRRRGDVDDEGDVARLQPLDRGGGPRGRAGRRDGRVVADRVVARPVRRGAVDVVEDDRDAVDALDAGHVQFLERARGPRRREDVEAEVLGDLHREVAEVVRRRDRQQKLLAGRGVLGRRQLEPRRFQGFEIRGIHINAQAGDFPRRGHLDS
mmetsp:Transcript_15585/g.62759  ORF Transcript_15585/g.62759 Transcript_15585/m.62759 type:complete len:242 (+) Transcript_15585:527-1252(+)